MNIPDNAGIGLAVLAGLGLLLVSSHRRLNVDRRIGFGLMCLSVLGIGVVVAVDTLAPIPAPTDLVSVEGTIIAIERKDPCRGEACRIWITLSGDDTPRSYYGLPLDERGGRLQVGRHVDVLAVRAGAPRSYLKTDLWEIRQVGRLLVTYADLVAFVYPRQVVFLLLGTCIGIGAIIAVLVVLPQLGL